MLGVAFNHVTKEVNVLTDCHWGKYISNYSTTGGKLEIVPATFEGEHAFYDRLTSHPSGPVALVNKKAVFYIQ